MPNEIATNKPTNAVSKLNAAASKLVDFYITDVANLNEAVGVPLNEESKRCATNVLVSLVSDIGAEAVRQIPRDQMLQVLQFTTINGLDIFSGQVFLDKRKDGSGKIASIKATPMGSAYEIMVQRFGVGVKTLHPARIVHEGDEFELPQYDGLKMTSVKHKMTLAGLDGKAIAVYYLIEKTDGNIEIAIATRESVAKNLMAQILQNALHDRSVDRGALMKHLEGKTLDELLSDEKLSALISPAYRSPATRESMIVTKMKKNALMHYTRDLGVNNPTAFAAVNSDIDDDSDMVVAAREPANITDPSAPKKPEASKVADFTVEDEEEPIEGEVVEPKPEEPKVEEEKVEEPAPKAEAKPQPKFEPKPEPKPETISIFDTDDL